MKRLIQSALLPAIAALGLIGAGCASTEASHNHNHTAAAPVQKDAAPAKTGLGCTQCTCHKFEPRVEDPGSCRMCWHSAAAHTRQ